jgi:hypothetical protein
MSILDDLRAQKNEGERERNQKLEEERRLEAEAAARVRAEDEARRAELAEKELKEAEAAYATLPQLVRQAAEKGLKAAVLSRSFVEEHVDGEKPAFAIMIERRKFYLTGWQIPFYEMCRRDRIPLTVVTEEVDTGMKKLLHRKYHFLAVDMTGL